MVDIPEKKESLLTSKKDVWEKARVSLNVEQQKELEKGELLPEEEKVVKEEIMREIEAMQLDDNLKAEAEAKIKKITSLGDEEKIKHLIIIAKEKGLVFAIKLAVDMNDANVLDTFHDILAREGFFKRFLVK